jgi:anaerobic magnesium-protoporphyrin IX monomethyl ester cyclase
MLQTTLLSATLGEDGRTEPPLGPLYIAAALESAGWEVDFRDYQIFEGADAFDPEQLVRFIQGHHNVLMISCLVDMLPVILAAAELIKAARPETYILLGGPGPTAGAAEFLRVFPEIDAIVMGEGEETIQAWAAAYASSDLNARKPIPGMVYRSGDEIVEGGARARIRNLESGVRPAYHLLDWKHYSAGRIITTRGCPYHCSFCDVAPLWGRKATYRDVTSAVEEMILLQDRYNAVGVSIADDTFVLNRDRVREFCHTLLDRGADIQWGCFGRINLMSEELIALMAEAGCRAIFYGIDSGSPRILDRTLKEVSVESILPTLEMSSRYFDRIEASFIWGYPFETYEDFLCTLDLAARASQFSPTVNVQLHMLSPLPSSPIYQEFKDTLIYPEAEDSRFLLLPALLLDERASIVRRVIERAPHLFPGFFSLPTPDKERKRARLNEVFTSLEAMIGRAILDEKVHALWTAEDRILEKELINFSDEASNPERIGTGLALGVFKRLRESKKGSSVVRRKPIRAPGLVRQRNDALLRVL